jgi:histidinol dehydrogenase
VEILQIDGNLSLKRTVDGGTEEQRKAVQAIIAEVRSEGDKALMAFTKKFDSVTLDEFSVTEEEISEAYNTVSSQLVDIITEAAANIRKYHEKQLRPSWMTTEENGTMLGQKVTPLDSVGVYVPGGTAAYPSSVLMNVIPARTAGVERIVMVSPPGQDGKLPAGVLVAAHIAGRCPGHCSTCVWNRDNQTSR